MSRSRLEDALTLVVAAALHVLAILLVRAPSAPPAAEAPPIVTEVIVGSEPIEQPPPPPMVEPGPAAFAPTKTIAPALPKSAIASVSGLTAPSGTTSTGGTSWGVPGPPDPGPSGSSSGPPATSPKSATPFPSLIDPSPGKFAIILPKEAPPVSKEAQVAAKLDAELKKQLDQKSLESGGGFGGPVVTAAHDASSSTIAPSTGGATIAVDTNAAGVITGVTVLSFSADGPGWNAVAGRMQKLLEPKRLRVPIGASGVRVTVRVDAQVKLPSGKKDGTSFDPSAWDLSDIGAKATRVVSVRIVEERRL